MRVDRASREIAASPSQIYAALTARQVVETWLPPSGARGVMEAFDLRPGGAFRMTLIFDDPGETGGMICQSFSIIGPRLNRPLPPRILSVRSRNLRMGNPLSEVCWRAAHCVVPADG